MKSEHLDPQEIYKEPFPELQPLQVKCPGCGSPVGAENINIHQNLAKCTSCTSVYHLNTATPLRQRPEIFMPKGVEVLELSNELDIELSWRSSLNSGLLFFTLFWNAIVLPIAAAAIYSGELIGLLGMSIHLTIGLCLLYYHITLIFNRTNIIVADDYLYIEHRPLKLPFYGDSHFPTDEIEQVYVEKYVQSRTNDRPNYVYAVSILKNNGEKLKMVKGIKHLDQARYIEQEIENYLLIQDEQVEGEYKKEKLGLDKMGF